MHQFGTRESTCTGCSRTYDAVSGVKQYLLIGRQSRHDSVQNCQVSSHNNILVAYEHFKCFSLPPTRRHCMMSLGCRNDVGIPLSNRCCSFCKQTSTGVQMAKRSVLFHRVNSLKCYTPQQIETTSNVKGNVYVNQLIRCLRCVLLST